MKRDEAYRKYSYGLITYEELTHALAHGLDEEEEDDLRGVWSA